MLSTFPIPIAPADEGDCDMMGLRFQWRQESLLREGESLEMTVRAGPIFSGELGTTAGPKSQKQPRQNGLAPGRIGHLASHSPSLSAMQEDGAGCAGDEKECQAGRVAMAGARWFDEWMDG